MEGFTGPGLAYSSPDTCDPLSEELEQWEINSLQDWPFLEWGVGGGDGPGSVFTPIYSILSRFSRQ